MNINIAVVGSRTLTSMSMYCYVDKTITDYVVSNNIVDFTIISGGLTGIDNFAIKSAKVRQFKFIEFMPDWDTLGIVAGIKRNNILAKNCDVMLAFWDGKSTGTIDIVNRTLCAGKRVIVHHCYDNYVIKDSKVDLNILKVN